MSLEIDRALSRDACVFLFGRSIKLTQSLSGIVFLVYLFFPPLKLLFYFIFLSLSLSFSKTDVLFELGYFLRVSSFFKTTNKRFRKKFGIYSNFYVTTLVQELAKEITKSFCIINILPCQIL